jgi:hypothetical protein
MRGYLRKEEVMEMGNFRGCGRADPDKTAGRMFDCFTRTPAPEI